MYNFEPRWCHFWLWFIRRKVKGRLLGNSDELQYAWKYSVFLVGTHWIIIICVSKHCSVTLILEYCCASCGQTGGVFCQLFLHTWSLHGTSLIPYLLQAGLLSHYMVLVCLVQVWSLSGPYLAAISFLPRDCLVCMVRNHEQIWSFIVLLEWQCMKQIN